MSFLTLNGTAVRVRSNALQQKDNEHRIDRDRMFDGTMRMTRGGVFRQWDVTTALLSESDANSLLALVRSGNVLTANGDVIGGVDTAVMPVPGGDNPVHVGGGQFKRQVTFTLHETGGPLPADTSAVPFIFLRAGTHMFSDTSGTVAAGDTDPIGHWSDATGNGRYATDSGAVRPHRDGDVVHFDETGDATYGSALQFDAGTISDWNGLVAAEIMAAVRADVFPAASNAKGALWWFGDEGGSPTFYSKTDSHLWGGFGTGGAGGGAAYDLGLAPDDLSTAYHVFGEASDATAYTARFDNTLIFTELFATDGHSHLFNTIAPAIGHGNPSANDHWLGRIKHLVIFDGVLTASQRRSWYDFMRGAVVDPPLP